MAGVTDPAEQSAADPAADPADPAVEQEGTQ